MAEARIFGPGGWTAMGVYAGIERFVDRHRGCASLKRRRRPADRWLLVRLECSWWARFAVPRVGRLGNGPGAPECRDDLRASAPDVTRRAPGRERRSEGVHVAAVFIELLMPPRAMQWDQFLSYVRKA